MQKTYFSQVFSAVRRGLLTAGFLFFALVVEAQAQEWVFDFGGTAADSPRCLQVDDQGTVHILTHFSKTLLVGGLPFTATGFQNVFWAQVNSSGAVLSMSQFEATSGSGLTNLEACAIAPDQSLYLLLRIRGGFHYRNLFYPSEATGHLVLRLHKDGTVLGGYYTPGTFSTLLSHSLVVDAESNAYWFGLATKTFEGLSGDSIVAPLADGTPTPFGMKFGGMPQQVFWQKSYSSENLHDKFEPLSSSFQSPNRLLFSSGFSTGVAKATVGVDSTTGDIVFQNSVPLLNSGSTFRALGRPLAIGSDAYVVSGVSRSVENSETYFVERHENQAASPAWRRTFTSNTTVKFFDADRAADDSLVGVVTFDGPASGVEVLADDGSRFSSGPSFGLERMLVQVASTGLKTRMEPLGTGLISLTQARVFQKQFLSLGFYTEDKVNLANRVPSVLGGSLGLFGLNDIVAFAKEIPVQPKLTIENKGDHLLLKWPAWASQFVLERASELGGSGVSWTRGMTATQDRDFYFYEYNLPSTPQKKVFFRLVESGQTR